MLLSSNQTLLQRNSSPLKLFEKFVQDYGKEMELVKVDGFVSVELFCEKEYYYIGKITKEVRGSSNYLFTKKL